MAKTQSRISRRRKPARKNRQEKTERSLYVWCDPTGLGRNVFAIFRRSFSLPAAAMKDVRAAEIRVFADTRYRLWVNGQIVSYGPARFVPSHPECDVIDLRPWLRKGRNAIVVEANSFGAKQYHAMPSIGGFIATGAVRAGKTVVDLRTPGEWKMHKAEAWDGDAPAFSFAQPAVEICDLRALPAGFREAEFDDSSWPAPVVVEKQEAWGTRIARTIPPLTMELHEPDKLLVNAALASDEEVIGGRIPGYKPEGENGGQVRSCYAVNIYSPTEQEATLGLFWGPHYLNGHEIHPHKRSARPTPAWNETRPMPVTGVPGWCTDRGNREDYPVRLREGWNFLYGEPEVLRGQQGVLLGLPTGKGLVASADRDPNSPHTMMFSEGMPIGVLKAARDGEIPPALEALPSLPVPWHRVERGSIPPLPGRLIGWDLPASEAPPSMPQRVGELHVPADTPWTFVFDLGRELMGHIALDVSAPAGTIIDVAYDERLRDNGMVAIYHSQWILDSADRFIASGGRQRIEGFHGRACRFVQISLRNATGPVTLHRVHYRQTILPIDVQGRFESSDPVLDWLYPACVHSIRPCTDSILNADALRENAMYINDTVPIYNSLAAFHGDPAIMRRCLRLYAHSQSPEGGIPVVAPGWWGAGGSNPWFVCLLEYYLNNTGDTALLRELWPHVVRALDAPIPPFGPRGLIDTGNREGWFDWGMSPEVMRGENFNPNAHYFGARQYAAKMAMIVKDTKRARQYRAEAARMKSAYQALWDQANQRYAATLVDGKPQDISLPHPNVLALYYGLADRDKVAGALACVEEWMGDEKFLAPGHLELAYHFWALEVLYEYGKVALAEHVMRRTWGILKNFGAWSIWETIGLAMHGDQQLCQGWGTAPLMIMARRILGVRPSAENVNDVIIAPAAETLRFARGAVAHPAGPIEVDWRVHGAGNGEWLAVDVAAPRSVKVRIEPRGALAGMPMRETVRRYSAHIPA